jgi:hypothetical protein
MIRIGARKAVADYAGNFVLIDTVLAGNQKQCGLAAIGQAENQGFDDLGGAGAAGRRRFHRRAGAFGHSVHFYLQPGGAGGVFDPAGAAFLLAQCGLFRHVVFPP